MPFLHGESVQVGIGKETTRGTAAAPTVWLPSRTPSGIRTVQDKTLIRETRASGSMSSGSEITSKRAEGDLEFNVRSSSIGHILLSLLGQVATTGSAGAFIHTFTPIVNAQHPTLTLALAQPFFQAYQYPGAQVSSLEIRTPISDLVNATASFVARNENPVGAYTVATASDDYYFRQHDVRIKFASTASGLDAATPIDAKDFSLRINTNAKPDMVIGSLAAKEVLAGLREIGGSLKLNYENTNYYNTFLGGGYQAMRLEMTRSDIAGSPRLQIDLPKVSFEDVTPDRPLDGIVTQDVNFAAHYDEAAARDIVARLYNATALY